LVNEHHIAAVVKFAQARHDGWRDINGALPGAACQHQHRIRLFVARHGGHNHKVHFDLWPLRPSGIQGPLDQTTLHFIGQAGHPAGLGCSRVCRVLKQQGQQQDGCPTRGYRHGRMCTRAIKRGHVWHGKGVSQKWLPLMPMKYRIGVLEWCVRLAEPLMNP
jgi:hypothetical protein